jgi:hypothetical protein
MKQLRYVCAQPAIPYYTWQVEVMLNNFIEMGVNPNHIDVVCTKPNGEIPEAWSKLAHKYAARFFFYEENRETKHYPSSTRPNILKQHFKAHPYLKDDAIFYYDADIIFTQPPHQWITSEMINDDKWYGSDTRWYIAHSYIVSKGEDILDKMCEIVNIDKQVVKDNELNCIGAQYLMKDIDYDFWNTVEIHSERLFKEITDMNEEKVQIDRRTMSEGESRAPYHPIQIWCADMWAVLWNGWMIGKETVCHPNFEFSWGTSDINTYNRHNIFHNAGVTSSEGGLFYKAQWMNELPYGKDLKINDNTASNEYWKWIQKVGNKSCLI